MGQRGFDDLATSRLRRTSAEYSDSFGHSIAQTAITQQLMQHGLPLATGPNDTRGIRYNQTQVVGRHGSRTNNRPDISYLSASGRVNIEIDSDQQASQDHQRTLIENDPDSRHIFLITDPRTGQVTERRIYNPRTGNVRTILGEQAARVMLPRPQGTRANTNQQPMPPAVSFWSFIPRSLAVSRRRGSSRRISTRPNRESELLF